MAADFGFSRHYCGEQTNSDLRELELRDKHTANPRRHRPGPCIATMRRREADEQQLDEVDSACAAEDKHARQTRDVTDQGYSTAFQPAPSRGSPL